MIAVAALVYAVFVIIKTLLYGADVAGYPSMMVANRFFGGLQLLSLGVLGDYVGRILVETKHRPIYVVRERIGVEGGELWTAPFTIAWRRSTRIHGGSRPARKGTRLNSS